VLYNISKNSEGGKIVKLLNLSKHKGELLTGFAVAILLMVGDTVKIGLENAKFTPFWSSLITVALLFGLWYYSARN
jgi:hypothetical protein